jgi:hypothetical protein
VARALCHVDLETSMHKVAILICATVPNWPPGGCSLGVAHVRDSSDLLPGQCVLVRSADQASEPYLTFGFRPSHIPPCTFEFDVREKVVAVYVRLDVDTASEVAASLDAFPRAHLFQDDGAELRKTRWNQWMKRATLLHTGHVFGCRARSGADGTGLQHRLPRELL